MSTKVKIRLTKDLPLNEEITIYKGDEFDAEYRDSYTDEAGVEQRIYACGRAVNFTALYDIPVTAFNWEYEVVEN